MSSISEATTCGQPWFEDGNIIIAAEEKHFRVHRGVLCSYSSVFKDMFSSSHPDSDSTMEGCPIVTLQDSFSDVQRMLQAMYDRGYASPTETISFPTLSAFLRLGKKYLIQRLFDQGKNALEVYVRNLTTEALTCNGPPSLDTNIVDQDKYNFQMINLAREIQIFSVLPAALFVCAVSCPMDYLLDGYEDNKVGFCKLSPENQRACLRGRDELHLVHARVFKWATDYKMRICCTDPDKCAKGCNQILLEVWDDSNVLRNPFVGWKTEWESSLCIFYCGTNCKDWHKKAREEAWRKLPSTFGLAKSWEELKSKSFSCLSDSQMS